MADPVDRLASAVAEFARLLDGVTDEQWAAPTPCSEWTVRDLVAHVVNGDRLFTAALRGAEFTGPRDDDDLVAAFRSGAAELVAAFRAPDALRNLIRVPFGEVPGAVALHLRTTEFLVHAWDLARATGRTARFPDDVVTAELAFTERAVREIPPTRTPFAAPTEIAADAPVLDRLAALLGRTV